MMVLKMLFEIMEVDIITTIYTLPVLNLEVRNKPEDDLASRIEKDFGSFESLKEKLSSAAMGRFGSGWAWLSANKSGQLRYPLALIRIIQLWRVRVTGSPSWE